MYMQKAICIYMYMPCMYIDAARHVYMLCIYIISKVGSAYILPICKI